MSGLFDPMTEKKEKEKKHDGKLQISPGSDMRHSDTILAPFER